MKRYKIKDNFFRFWYKFVYPFQEQIQSGIDEQVIKKIYKELDDYCGKIFEDVVTEFFLLMRGKKVKDMKIEFTEYGKWWENDEDIDLVLKNKGDSIFVEVKFQNKIVGSRIFEELKDKSLKTSVRGKLKYVIVSKRGFEQELINRKMPNLLLLTLDELEEIMDNETKRMGEIQVDLKEWFGVGS